jgi:hypothetical protein
VNISLSNVQITITFRTWSKYVRHSAVGGDTDEISAPGIFGYEAKMVLLSDRKPSVVRRETGCVKNANGVCNIGVLSIFVGEEAEKVSYFLDAVSRCVPHILPQMPATSGLDSIHVFKQNIILCTACILLRKLVSGEKEEAVIPKDIVVAVST